MIPKKKSLIKKKHLFFFTKVECFVNAVLEDFQILKILGRGAYGKVYLVQYKQNNPNIYYAMKSIKK